MRFFFSHQVANAQCGAVILCLTEEKIHNICILKKNAEIAPMPHLCGIRLLVFNFLAMKRAFLLLFFVLVMFVGCSEKDYLVVIRTPYGDMKAVLYDDTPQHKENFLALVRNKSYDGTIFHRVIEEFMIQGGDVNAGTGVGAEKDRPTIDYTIPAEGRKHYYHVKGALSAARQGDRINPEKASSGCQFYIVHGKVWDEGALRVDKQKLQEGIYKLMEGNPEEYAALGEELRALYTSGDYEAYEVKMNEMVPVVESELGMDLSSNIPEERIEKYTTVGGAPHLDENYTVFGMVVDGLDVIDKVAAVETDKQDKPLENITMTMELEEMSKDDITKNYGIKYPEVGAAEGAGTTDTN